MRRARRTIRDAGVILAVTGGLLVLSECAVRVYGRLRSGRWTHPSLIAFIDTAREVTRIYRRHPYLNAAPREGSRVAALGKIMSFNSLGYRSPERPAPKPPGVTRIVCSGGSTTFDVLAASDDRTWPWLLETELQRRGQPVEVWNAGFPGWTSLENLISLAIRDVDLAPDVVVLFQGINDLQPATQVPFNGQYEGFHTQVILTTLGLDMPSVPWYEHSLLLETVRTRLFGPRPFVLELPGQRDIVQREEVPHQAIGVFERNVKSFVTITRSHDATAVLVTQPVRLRRASANADARYMERWIPGLKGERVPVELERFNDVLRSLASTNAVLADAAADIVWNDEDFGDPLHFAPSGSAKLVQFLADRITAALRRRKG